MTNKSQTDLIAAQAALANLTYAKIHPTSFVFEHFDGILLALQTHIRVLEAQAKGGKMVSLFANSKMEIAGKDSLKYNQDYSERALAALTWQAMHAAAPNLLAKGGNDAS